MNKKTREYLRHIETLSYPEYASKKESLEVFLKRSNANVNFRAVDLSLLDLSLSESDEVDRNLYKVLDGSYESIGKYSYSQNEELKRDLAKNLGVYKENVFISAGCDGALRIISQLLIKDDSVVLIPLPSFSRYEYHTKVNMGKIIFVHPEGFPYDFNMQEILNVSEQSKADIIFIANPNNPTGIRKSRSEVEWLIKRTKSLVVLDESLLMEFGDSCSDLVRKYENLIVCGSFSKIYGLAGLRIGYFIVHKSLTKAFHTLISPFEVSSISIAFAKYLLTHQEIIRRKVKRITQALRLVKKIDNGKISVSPSDCGTILVKSFKHDNLYKELLKNMIKTVSCKQFRGIEASNCVRVSVKDPDSMRLFIDVLNKL